jgi:predicted PurR-regulated permease PerM
MPAEIMATGDRTARRSFFALFGIVAVLVAIIARRFVGPLFVAAILAVIVWPAHQRLTRRLGGRRTVSAGIWAIAMLVVIVGPAVPIAIAIVNDAVEGVQFIAKTLHGEGAEGLLQRLPSSLQRLARAARERLPAWTSSEVAHQLSAQGGRATAALSATVYATGRFLFRAGVMLVGFVAFLLEGDRLVAGIVRLSPLREGQTRELLLEFKRTSYAVVVSTLVTAMVQAAVALVGYLIARVPHPLFFAGATLLAAFIPFLGASSIAIVATLLLYLTGHKHAALFMGLWAVLVVGLVDNLVKPHLASSGTQMSGVVVFFALIGGAAAFGAVGVLLGPLAVALFLALLRMYERDYRSEATILEA